MAMNMNGQGCGNTRFHPLNNRLQERRNSLVVFDGVDSIAFLDG